MLEAAWQSAQRWAQEARAQKAKADWWRKVTFGLTIGTAFLAALSGVVGAPPPSAEVGVTGLQFNLPNILSGLAGLISAVAALLSRHVLDGNAEKKWITARAVAECIRSECYRYAGCVIPYDKDAAANGQTLAENKDRITQSAVDQGAQMAADVNSGGGRGMPQPGMDMEWYKHHRIHSQRNWYLDRANKHRKDAERLRGGLLALSIMAAIMGFLGMFQTLQFLTAFVGMVTTVAALVAVHGALERKDFLSSTYMATAEALETLLGRFDVGSLNQTALILEVETLLTAEYKVWANRMSAPDRAITPQTRTA